MYQILRKEPHDILARTGEAAGIWEDIVFPGIDDYKGFYLPALSSKEERILAAVNKTLVIPA
jgi:hypothetical protein